jgi:hypothetical protein
MEMLSRCAAEWRGRVSAANGCSSLASFLMVPQRPAEFTRLAAGKREAVQERDGGWGTGEGGDVKLLPDHVKWAGLTPHTSSGPSEPSGSSGPQADQGAI